MTKITFKVLAEDIRTSDYINIFDCPIARAVKREYNKKKGVSVSSCIVHIEHKAEFFIPQEVQNKLHLMYAYLDPKNWEEFIIRSNLTPIKPQDFEFEIDLQDYYGIL